MLYVKNMTRKRVKFSRKSKNKKEDKSKIVDDEQQTKERMNTQDPQLLEFPKCIKKKEKCAKHVHIAFLPEKYEPLVEDEVFDTPSEDNIKKKQDKCKQLRKNVGKALRYSWKCLVVGLQTFSAAYSTPLSAVVPEIHRARPYA